MTGSLRVDNVSARNGKPTNLVGQSAAKVVLSLQDYDTILYSLNVSGTTDNGIGRYGVSFLIPLSGEWASATSDRSAPRNGCVVSRTVYDCEIRTYNSSADWAHGAPDLIIFGDLA
ncbi:hypothetical protein [Curvivirga sp.]|uniref:hypothetical protein n=1 Tax=Curvivirga sp. TaxID=2856848 RepID=UPI003B5935E5